jgi:hypothetical protein
VDEETPRVTTRMGGLLVGVDASHCVHCQSFGLPF